ncbi:hypothetical protein [Pectobacterium carotovorum]|uniref:Uncharacterized protein n=1 Tax=Pectobacterium carotovorum TaxID=554 RepID=A0A419AVW2_PECCA|nr:hypothetical protein [Pectobacterium carotovorum]RJL51205.1 hypothetical protein D5071_11370 [Pectobacterium carotovorum]
MTVSFSSSSSFSSIYESQETNPTLKTKTKSSHAILSKIKSIFRNEKHIHSKNTSAQINQTEKPSTSLLSTPETESKSNKYAIYSADKEKFEEIKKIFARPPMDPKMEEIRKIIKNLSDPMAVAEKLKKEMTIFQVSPDSTPAKNSMSEQVNQTKNHQLPLYSFKPAPPPKPKLADFQRNSEMTKAKHSITKNCVDEQISQAKRQLPTSSVKPVLPPKPIVATIKIQPNLGTARVNTVPIFFATPVNKTV